MVIINVSHSFLDQSWKNVDKDGSGDLSLFEFIQVMLVCGGLSPFSLSLSLYLYLFVYSVSQISYSFLATVCIWKVK
jgi:hypothetical protein